MSSPQSWGPPGPGQQPTTWGGQPSSGSGFGSTGFGQPGAGGQAQPYWQHRPSTAPAGRPVATPQPGGGRPSGGSSKRNPLSIVLITMIGLVVAGIAVLIVVALANAGGETRYVNEDYTPPPPDLAPSALPQPTTMGEAESWTSDNTLYGQTYPTPVACDLQPIDLDAVSDAELEEHMNVLMGCLTGAWVIPLEAVGQEMPRPSVTVYQGGTTVNTPCGELPDMNAVYCSRNQQVYYSNNLQDAIPELKQSRYGAELVMAHEYAHAVQGRSGILNARLALMNAVSTEEEAYRINRRLEAQADCFAGLFIRSASPALGIEQADLTSFQAVFRALGSSEPGKTHPMSESRTYWSQVGMSTDDIGACNTFTAPPETVE
ncbi:neutral zinc metallopeptidase [Propionibacteriaceae bacterium Y2011]